MGAEIDRLEIEIEAAAAKANKELDKLVNRLEKISGSLLKIDTKKLSGFSAGLGQYTSKTSSASRETNRISKSFANLSKNITGSGKSFSQMAGSFYANSFLIIRGLKKLKSSIEESMDYVETYNYFSVTMDKIGREFGKDFEKYGYDSANSYANSFKDRMNELTRKMTGYNVGSNGELFMSDSVGLGLDPEAIMNYQASISAITNSVGLIGENSVNASKALTMLAADMSSLKNVDISTAMTNFQSGLIGQSRALYKYGIDITNATLQTYAYELGLSKSVSEMTQAEKMQLRLIAILDQSKVAWGDQARTINSVANQYRIFKQQVSNLARVIGNLFLPIVQKVLPVVNGLVIALQRLFNALGFKLWGGNWLKDTMEGIGGVGGGDALDELAGSAEDTADGFKDASKASEKLKTMVRGIDELNIIRPDDSSSTGSGVGNVGGDIDLSNAISAALAEYESVWEEAFKNAENKAQEFADKICSIFNRIWEAIEPFRESLKKLWDEGLSLLMGYTFQNLLDFYNLFLVPIGKWAFGTEDSGMTRFVNIVNERLMQIDWVWISDNLRKFWRAIEPFAEQFGEGLIDFFEDISKITVGIINKLFGRNGAITGITDWLNSNDSEKARKWGYALGVLATGILSFKPAIALVSGLHKLVGAILAIITSVKILSSGGLLASGGVLSGIANVIALVAGGAGTIHEAMVLIFGAASTITAGIVGIVSGLALAVTNFFSMWSEGFRWIKEGLMVLGTALVAVGAVILGAPALVAAAVAGIVAAVATVGIVMHDNWDKIVKFFTESIPDFWNNHIVPWFTKEKWGAEIEHVKEAFLQKWNELVEWWSNSAIVQWWNNHIVPWFTKEKWGGIANNIKASIIDKFKEMVTEWRSKISNWWKENVTPWFTVEKWQGVSNNIKTSIITKFKEMVTEWKNNIKSWWDNHVYPWFTKEKWVNAMSGIKEGFSGAFKNAANAAIDIVNRLIRYLNEKLKISWDGFKLPNGERVLGFSKQLFSINEIPHFAQGGYPETGQLFLARENGLNEMVGRIGNRSAVANNDQIVQAITAGVANGINFEEQNSLLREQNELLRALLAKDTDIQLDGKSLVSGIDTAKKRMGYNFRPQPT